MLLKKVNYFYKIYIRQLKKNYPDINNINDLIKIDIEEYQKNKLKKFSLDYENLSKKEDYEMNIETLLIMDFFREFEGINPLLKNQKSNKLDLNNLNQDISENNENEGLNQNKLFNRNENNQPLPEDYYTFLELTLEDKIKFLYFFCK